MADPSEVPPIFRDIAGRIDVVEPTPGRVTVMFPGIHVEEDEKPQDEPDPSEDSTGHNNREPGSGE